MPTTVKFVWLGLKAAFMPVTPALLVTVIAATVKPLPGCSTVKLVIAPTPSTWVTLIWPGLMPPVTSKRSPTL